jgi:ethanolamine ammonia-lyase small subunit
MDQPSKPSPWQALRQFTAARIALGHTGVSQPTAAQLDFQLAHARARDAVHVALDAEALQAALGEDTIVLHSAAQNRDVYLQRPDLGRRLDAHSAAALAPVCSEDGVDLVFVIADGLSALAVASHAAPFLQALRPRLSADGWTVAPPVIVHQGRVAIGDEVGQLLKARIVVVLIGERPGLSSPDSMGIYITWAPRIGLTDERRNCISNVRPAGLAIDDAAAKLHYLLTEARSRCLTGVMLKDETDDAVAIPDNASRKFLL